MIVLSLSGLALYMSFYCSSAVLPSCSDHCSEHDQMLLRLLAVSQAKTAAGIVDREAQLRVRQACHHVSHQLSALIGTARDQQPIP